MYICVRLCVMILNTLAEAIKTQGYIVGLQLSLVVWFLLYCEWSYETLYNESTKQEVTTKLLLYSRVKN